MLISPLTIVWNTPAQPRNFLNMPLGRGVLIAIEGIDRAGKTTQIQRLDEYDILDILFKVYYSFFSARTLSVLGYFHRLIKFPNDQTILGSMLREYTLGNRHDIPSASSSFLFTSNRWEQQPRMGNDMLEGMTIIVDRYSHSGAAYETARVSTCIIFTGLRVSTFLEFPRINTNGCTETGSRAYCSGFGYTAGPVSVRFGTALRLWGTA